MPKLGEVGEVGEVGNVQCTRLEAKSTGRLVRQQESMVLRAQPPWLPICLPTAMASDCTWLQLLAWLPTQVGSSPEHICLGHEEQWDACPDQSRQPGKRLVCDMLALEMSCQVQPLHSC